MACLAARLDGRYGDVCNVLSCRSMEQKNVEISFRSPDEGYCMRYAKPLRFIPDSSVRCIEYTTERLFPKKMRFLVRSEISEKCRIELSKSVE